MSTYIKLEDVLKTINESKYIDGSIIPNLVTTINSLPSIDFEKMIKEMIKEYEGIDGIYHEVTDTLKELLAKLPK